MLNRVARLSLAETAAFSLPQRAPRLTVTSYVEWRAVHFADVTTTANFEVVFHENDQDSFDVIYGATSDSGLDETSGVQANGTPVRLRPSRVARRHSLAACKSLTPVLEVAGARRQRQRQQVHRVAAR